MHIFLIEDAVVGFEQDVYVVFEVTGVVEVCVDSGVTEGFQTNLTVTINASNGSASE